MSYNRVFTSGFTSSSFICGYSPLGFVFRADSSELHLLLGAYFAGFSFAITPQIEVHDLYSPLFLSDRCLDLSILMGPELARQ